MEGNRMKGLFRSLMFTRIKVNYMCNITKQQHNWILISFRLHVTVPCIYSFF